MSDNETWAAGYASSPIALDETTWTRWRREIQAHAHKRGLRLAGIFTDQPPAPGQSAKPDAPATCTDPQLQKLVHLIRERAHLRTRHISVLLVPTIEHLAPGRDGTHDMVRNLMELHFGLRVEQVVAAAMHLPDAQDDGPLPACLSPDQPDVPSPANTAPLAGRARFHHILHGTAHSGAAVSQPAPGHVEPPIAGRPVMTSLCGPAGHHVPGFQSPGFVPGRSIPVTCDADSSTAIRNPR